MTGKIIQTSTGYTVQINVTDTTLNTRIIASYSANCTAAELDNHTAIQKASLDLLTQMGVQLTDNAKNELNTINTQQAITAQTALARGITAQRQGTEVAALSYFFQAVAFEPSLVEAVNRSSILAANISSGNIGEDARNDIQWRKDWIDRLAETEQFFNNYFDNFFQNTPYMPYTLLYTSDIKQVGEINYQAETVTLGIVTTLLASQDWIQSVEPVLRSMQESLQAVLNGLNSTKRKTVWGLDTWPQQGSFNIRSFGRQNNVFSVTVELVNSRNQVIGRQTFQISGTYELIVPLPDRGTQLIHVSEVDSKTVTFPNVKVNDITDSLTIRIATVNGTTAETAARNGVLQIEAVTNELEFNLFKFSIFNREITAYTGSGGELIIPTNIMGVSVTSIGEGAFGRKSLTNVTVPNGVASIGNTAFSSNQLSTITLPESITTIGYSAFFNNHLTSINIPSGITSIERSTFQNNRLTSINIPESVTSIGNNAFNYNQLTRIIIPKKMLPK